ncbi:MAG: hypothetical protein ACRDUY_09575 [Nitriliruptorales bacterium]
MAEATPDDALQLDDEERELVAQEVAAFLPALKGERRQRYEVLAEAVTTGSVPADLLPPLESLIEMTLQTARARQLYRAEGERILTAVYRRTPGGRELSQHLKDVNAALEALEGHTVEGVSVRMRTLGHFTITVRTDGAHMTLSARPESVDLESVSVGPA